MKIAVASGKGGTGKTTISTNLAVFLSKKEKTVTFLDCDVEEPNAHLFLHPQWHAQIDVVIPTPSIDKSRCINCGTCAQNCQFRAIADMGTDIMVFPELCHGCGLCTFICPEKAITEKPRTIGIVKAGKVNGFEFIHGQLKVGEPLATPIIKKVREHSSSDDFIIIDAPPGTSCGTIASMYDTDYVVLVTEPTPFGLHDLNLAVQVTRVLNLPCGVVINRADSGDRRVWDYCEKEGIEIIMELPHMREIAEMYSQGMLFLSHLQSYETHFEKMISKIQRQVIK
jgi:MinD superfamily P-loop ATPase